MTGLQLRRSSVAVVLLSSCALFSSGGISAQGVQFEAVGAIAGPAELIKIRGQYAYISADKTLRIVDISNPRMPNAVAEYAFPARITGFQVVDQLIYVAADVFGLGILDSSNPGVLILRGALKTTGQAKDVAVSGRKALVTDVVSGVDIVDVTNPSKPAQMGSIFLEGVAAAVTVAGPLAYASDRPAGFYVIDPEKPTASMPLSARQSSNPVTLPFEAQVAIVKTSASPPTTAVLIAGGLVQFFDVSNPAAPTELPPFRIPGFALRAAFIDTRAYIAAGPGGVQVVDLSSPATPHIIGAYKTATMAVDVAVDGSLMLVAVRPGDVIILRATWN